MNAENLGTIVLVYMISTNIQVSDYSFFCCVITQDSKESCLIVLPLITILSHVVL